MILSTPFQASGHLNTNRIYSYMLILWSRVLLEKPMVAQLLKKFPAFYEI
jgi:hypothetical protein